MSTKLKLFLAAVLALGGATIAVVAFGQEGGGGPAGPFAHQERVGRVEARLAARYAALRGPRARGDRLPRGGATALGEHPALGLNTSLARRAIDRRREDLYLVPARGALCTGLIDDSGTSLQCADADRAVRRGSGPATVRTVRGVTVYGIVPDGVGSVTVTDEAGDERRLEVENNAYLVELPVDPAPRTVSYSTAAGGVSEPIAFVPGPVEQPEQP